MKEEIKPQFLSVSTEQVDQRIDNFLIARLKGVPKSLIYRLLRQGKICVTKAGDEKNKKRVVPFYRLQEHDVIKVPAIRESDQPTNLPPSKRLCDELEQRILYEDNDLLIINKPAGLAVHGGSNINLGLIEALRAMRPDCKTLELVHRLDRGTSGCLMVAKKRSALKELHELLREGKIIKVYYALTLGHWAKDVNLVEAKLVKNILSSGERMVKPHAEEGKQSNSKFIVQEKFSMADLVKVRIYTGRTHQIRVHALHAGHPVAGDDKYGDKAFNHLMRKFGLRRLFLHAAELSFYLPSADKTIHIGPFLDDELQKVIDKMKSSLS